MLQRMDSHLSPIDCGRTEEISCQAESCISGKESQPCAGIEYSSLLQLFHELLFCLPSRSFLPDGKVE